MPELQFFVPWYAFLIQLGFAVLGACLLACSSRPLSAGLVFASAYPLGAAAAALLQLICLLIGLAHYALFVIGAVFVVLLLIIIRRARNGQAPPWRWPSKVHWTQSAMAIIVFAAIGVGALIAESSDLNESDPRWQLAYRAKIIATNQSLDTPFFTDSNVLHQNRGYPLLLSCLEAVTYRMLGDVTRDSALRVIMLGYFASFLLLMLHVAWDRGMMGVICILAVLCVPNVWRLGTDEAYADFPLGVGAVFCLLWLCESVGNDSVWYLNMFLLAASLVGIKQEGYLLLATIGVANLLIRRDIGFSARLRQLIPMACGAGLLYLLHQVQLTYIARDSPYSNTTFVDKTTILEHGLSFIPFVVTRFCELMLDPKLFGCFFLLVLFRAPLMGRDRGLMPLAIGAAYLSIMQIPFLFIWIGDSPALPIQLSGARILTQGIPLLSIAFCESFTKKGV